MANQPDIIPYAWAANNSTTETIPATTTESGKASWDQGFPVETSLPLSQGGIPPKYGDFNGVLNVLSQFCLFAQSGGQYAWVNSLDYSVGSIVLGTDGSIYRAAQVSGPSTTAVNPVGDTSGKWERIVSKSDIDALEEDIQDAMDVASDAASNASAAQSAVTTLDANVVKLSGAQTISGAKTFSSSIVPPATTSTPSIVAPDNTGTVRICGGASKDDNQGAILGLNGATISASGYTAGAFWLKASTSSSAKKELIGKPDGTLTWDGKDIITNGGDQNIGGYKTFTSSPKIQRINPYLQFVETDWEKGESLTGTTYQGIDFCDKNGTQAAIIYYHYNASKNSWLQFSANDMHTSSATASTSIQLVAFADGNKVLSPLSPDVNLGYTGNSRWKQLYATTTTISTSDERRKTSISTVPDTVLDAWGDIQWQQFQMRDAVAEKGKNARLHNGLIAQRIDAVFKAHGLDANRYGLFCHDTWEAEPEERDPEGKLVREVRDAGDEYSLRYEEALAMEAAYQRRRADRAEARITALEQRLNEMEAVLASLISPISEEQTAEPEEPVVEETPEQEGEGADA